MGRVSGGGSSEVAASALPGMASKRIRVANTAPAMQAEARSDSQPMSWMFCWSVVGAHGLWLSAAGPVFKSST